MNTAVTPLSMSRTGLVGRPVDPARRGRIDRLARAVVRVVRALADLRGHTQLLALADSCEPLQPSLARELRAASRQGPIA